MFFAFPEDARWNAETQAVEFGVGIGEYQGVVRVRRIVFQRLVEGAVTPERCVEAYYLHRTRLEQIAERRPASVASSTMPSRYISAIRRSPAPLWRGGASAAKPRWSTACFRSGATRRARERRQRHIRRRNRHDALCDGAARLDHRLSAERR